MSLHLEIRGVADFNDGNGPRMWRRAQPCWPRDGQIKEEFADLPGVPNSLRLFDPDLRFWLVAPIRTTTKKPVEGDRLTIVAPFRIRP